MPVGTELFVQPSVSRLTLEVQVANDNALHHAKVSRDRGDWISKARKVLRKVQKPGSGISAELQKEIDNFLEPK